MKNYASLYRYFIIFLNVVLYIFQLIYIDQLDLAIEVYLGEEGEVGNFFPQASKLIVQPQKEHVCDRTELVVTFTC